MIKRPQRSDNAEDILRMQKEYEEQKLKNPNIVPSVQIHSGPPKKSLFAQSREKEKRKKLPKTQLPEEPKSLPVDIINEISIDSFPLIGDVVVRKYATSTSYNVPPLLVEDIPKVPFKPITVKAQPGKSLFALQMEADAKEYNIDESIEIEDSQSDAQTDLIGVCSSGSVIVQNAEIAKQVHKQNLDILSRMNIDEINAERDQLLNILDAPLIDMIKKLGQRKNVDSTAKIIETNVVAAKSQNIPMKETNTEPEIAHNSSSLNLNLSPSNPAVEILEQSSKENWLNFDKIEKDKLEWMQDIPQMAAKLKPGEQFQARFDFKGVLLPYCKDIKNLEKDERELYLHGEEPDRPGYTLQELFRLARSNIVQQRGAAFGAIARLLNIYNQGFYDGVIDLPLNKIFFLLRVGLDDQNPLMLEYTSKGLSFLLYNESDECLLDEIYELPVCHWQPTLKILENIDPSDTEHKSTDELIKDLQAQSKFAISPLVFQTDFNENPDENQTEMNDFCLAEKDLIAALMRTNILQRVYYILHKSQPNNSTVSSCLKILIRIARTSKELAMEIVNNKELILCLFEHFLPDMERVDTTLLEPPFYNYPQHLCLKLFRVLISQSRKIALKFLDFNILDKLQNYLFNRDNIKTELIKVQIESFRILRCLLCLHLKTEIYKKFLNSIRYMLEWHYNHVVYEVGGSPLIRKHASALLAVISTIPANMEVNYLLGDLLNDCCCNWFYKATRNGIKEFSQVTLLTVSLNAITWLKGECDTPSLHDFSDKYLCNFVTSDGFTELINSLSSSSIILRETYDRRFVNPQLPNVGAVLINEKGPYLIVTQNYPIFLLTSLWRLLNLELKQRKTTKLLNSLLNEKIVDPIVNYLRELSFKSNRYLANNFFAKTEIRFIFLLLCFDEFNSYFEKSEILLLVYNYLCCLTSEHLTAIEELFKRYIFNPKYIKVDESTLTKWCGMCLEEVYQHSIIVNFEELPLSKPFYEVNLLSKDWPYFHLKIILKNFLEVYEPEKDKTYSEHEAILMTIKFVKELEALQPNLQIVTPTEKLMYLMICFMGSDGVFLEPDINQLLRNYLLDFYEKHQNYVFDFDAIYRDKCRFENLYVLFVNQFQFNSYGNDLFSSLLMIPLAQKYDNRWRRRVWSEFSAALFYIDCDEKLLLGGLAAYLEPAETEKSLIDSYFGAIKNGLVKPNKLPYKIAKYHVEKYLERNGNLEI